jgi:hypothetical protein
MRVVEPGAEEKKQSATKLRKVRWTKRRTGDDTLGYLSRIDVILYYCLHLKPLLKI